MYLIDFYNNTIYNGTRKNNGFTFFYNWAFIILIYDFYTWAKPNGRGKQKYFIGCDYFDIYDFVWTWAANFHKSVFILSIFLRIFKFRL